MTEDVINVKTNPLSIGCPRAGCKCTIIRPGAATLVRRSSSSSDESQASSTAADGGASVTDGNNGGGFSALPGIGAPDIKLSSIDNVPSQIADLFTQPSSSSTATDAMDRWFWMLTDMMDFENVGFSHSVGSVKYLSCADCDLAPLGYHDTEQAKTGAKEFLIAADRVVYR